MKNGVFVSGSISIKSLPTKIKESIDKIIKQNLDILVGDANGVDRLVQEYCVSKNYDKVTVYSIFETPRYIASSNFKIKHIDVSEHITKPRERQQQKDKAMTLDSEFTFVVWDEQSKGSYDNILRGLENNKKIKVYLAKQDIFLKRDQITKDKIEFIYRKNNGYTASEVLKYLKNEKKNYFHKTQELNRYLLHKSIIKKENKVYQPTNKYKDLFIIDKYRGKIRGIRFKNEFISWIEKNISEDQKRIQANLF